MQTTTGEETGRKRRIHTTNPLPPLLLIYYHLELPKANAKSEARQAGFQSRTLWRRVEGEPGGTRRRQSGRFQWKSIHSEMMTAETSWNKQKNLHLGKQPKSAPYDL